MRQKGWRHLSLAVLMLCLSGAATPGFGQTDAGSLRVLVLDDSAAVVPGATVTITNAATGVATTRVSSEEGYATFSPLPRGTYTVETTLDGFQPVRTTNVTVDINQTRLLRVTMQVARLAEAVEVVAEAAPIQTEQASLGEVLKSEVIQELPLAARRYTDLALLVPGATGSTLNTEIRGPGWFTVNGTSHTQNNFILDGFDNNQGTTNMQSLSSQVVQPSPDAISEFKVQTNSFSAAFGRSAGAVVNVSLKSGTNSVHGSSWYYNRDDALASRSWRANLLNQPKDDLKWNQYGGTVGGPVVRNKLFYFGHYEGFKSDRTNFFLTQVPTADMRQGVFPFAIRDPLTGLNFPNNTIPADRFDPLGVKLVNLYAQPTQAGRTAAGGRIIENFAVARPHTEDTHKFDVRSDYYASDRDRIFARYSFLRQDVFRNPIFDPPADDGVEGRGQQYNRNHSLGASWSRTFGNAMVNEMRFGYNRTYAAFNHASIGGMTGTEFGFRNIPPELDSVGGLPQIGVSNYNNLGTGPWRPQYQAPDAYQVSDVLSLAKGEHSIQAGFEFRHKNNEFVDLRRRVPEYNFTGRFTGDAVADLLLGFTDIFRLNNFMVAEQLQDAWSGYLQDDWKVNPNLTLNAGLRYEYVTPYWAKEPNPHINFDFATRQLVRATDDDKYLVDKDLNNLAPRLGVAYQLKPDKVVLRGGYGMFYGPEEFRGSSGNMVLNPPNLIQLTLQPVGTGPPAIRLSDPVPGHLIQQWDPAQSRNVSLQTREREQQAITIHQWNVATEFMLPFNSSVEVAYVGNRSANLPGTFQINQVPFGVDGSIPANRPYPEWQNMELYQTKAHGSYDGLQLKFQRRMSNGWYNLTSYTFSHAISETGGFAAGNTPQYLDDWRSERANDSQTPRHRLSVANVYQLPIGRGRAIGTDMGRLADFLVGGWQISTLFTYQTGIPVNVSLATNGVDPATGRTYLFFNRNGGSLRPNMVGTPNSGIDPGEDRFRFLDVNAFQLQALNTPGNAPRNSAWGPSFRNIDLSLVKRFPIDAAKYIDLRIESFNTLNWVNYRAPAAAFGTPTFGIINDAFDPRVMQVAVRFAF
jgi:hypothetical protein